MKDVKTITRKQIISKIAERLDLYESSVEEVYNEFEKILIDSLMDADENKDIEIRFTDGIKLQSTFVPEHIHEHPLTKEPIVVDNKLNFSCKFTKHFKDKKIKEYRESRKLWDEYIKGRGKNLSKGYEPIKTNN